MDAEGEGEQLAGDVFRGVLEVPELGLRHDVPPWLVEPMYGLPNGSTSGAVACGPTDVIRRETRVLDRICQGHWEGVRMPGLKGHAVLGLRLRRRSSFPAEVRWTEMQLALLVQWPAPAP